MNTSYRRRHSSLKMETTCDWRLELPGASHFSLSLQLAWKNRLVEFFTDPITVRYQLWWSQ